MKKYRHFEPGEEDLPEGWDPSADKDEQWEALVAMMCEAEKCGPVPPARFDAIRLDARQQLLREGVLRATPARPAGEESFFSWLRQIVMGGGPGGQLVRFGAIGAFAFYLGSGLRDDQPSAFVPNITVAERPRPGANETATVAAQPAAAPALQAESTMVADASSAAAPAGFGIAKSTTQSDSTAGLPSFSAFTNDNGWGYPSGNSMARPVSAAPAAPRGGERNPHGVAADAIDQLQMLKLSIAFSPNQSKQALDQANVLEEMLAHLMADQEDSRYRAVGVYRQAEELNRAGRHSDALAQMDRAARMDPGSNLAMMARFQMGAIAYEHLHQYDLAADAFRSCLQEFPGQRLLPGAQAYLAARVQVIEETRSENWRSLHLWQEVQATADPAQQVDGLVRIVLDTVSPLLANNAVEQLREMMMADAPRRELNADGVARAIQTRLERGGASQEAVRMWQALGEIHALRLAQPEEAGRAYRKAEEIKVRLNRASSDGMVRE